jgi:signal transduction histidine kinase
LEVKNSVKEPFKIKASRIELSILIDNIISNADKALAKKMWVNISTISENTLRISFIDNGKGMSPDLPDTESMFEMGVTTTIGGSGLGLFHAKSIITKISGKISAIPLNDPTRMEIRIEVTK